MPTSSILISVSPVYRNHALLLVRRFLEQPGIDLFLNTTANENADRVLQAMRMPRFPVEDLDTCLYWVTRPRAFTESAFRRQGWPLPYLASLPAGLALSAVDRTRRGWLRRGSTEIEVRAVDRFDEQFDAFWQERRFDSMLRLRRDSGTLNCGTLNWLSEFARRRQDVWILTATSGDKLRGYGMFMERDAAEIGLRRMRIMDLQFRDNDLGAATAILAAALRRCRADGIHALETTGFQPVKRRLFTDLGARCRKLPNWRFYYKARYQDLASKLSSSAVWDPCSLDGDRCF